MTKSCDATSLTYKDDNACNMTSQNVTHVVEWSSKQEQLMAIVCRGERTVDLKQIWHCQHTNAHDAHRNLNPYC